MRADPAWDMLQGELAVPAVSDCCLLGRLWPKPAFPLPHGERLRAAARGSPGTPPVTEGPEPLRQPDGSSHKQSPQEGKENYASRMHL